MASISFRSRMASETTRKSARSSPPGSASRRVQSPRVSWKRLTCSGTGAVGVERRAGAAAARGDMLGGGAADVVVGDVEVAGAVDAVESAGDGAFTRPT